MSAEQGEAEVCTLALDTLHEWMPKYPEAWPGWCLELTAKNEGAGYLVYDLLPHDAFTWHEAPRRFAVRVAVEELSVRELPRD